MNLVEHVVELAADFGPPDIGDIRYLWTVCSLVVWILLAKPVPAFLDNEVIKMLLDDFVINLIFVSNKICQNIADVLDYLILELFVPLEDGSKGAFLFLLFCLKLLWIGLHITMVIRNRRLFF